MPAEITTPRLLLRRPRLDDADAVLAIEGDPRTARFRPDGPMDRERSDAYLASHLADWADDGLGYWMVEHDGELVGFTGQRRLDAPSSILPGVEPEALLNTYWRFSPGVWGAGVPTEAVRAAIDATLAAGTDRPVVAITTPDNVPSRRMAERVGMRLHREVAHAWGVASVEYRLPVPSAI
ncbi:GNAT family N-acetyltransferase [Solicola sp. PLA-1-18]|uniref:GNAT family N-acetyltransferase n=1 Tax=Solicola sp. PLA-1-18 TaxID=3380532 RepID=UPI003B7B0609